MKPMKNNKLTVLSYNSLSSEFWSFHLNSENLSTINAVDFVEQADVSVLSDVIIVDEYFSEGHEIDARNLIELLNVNCPQSKVYHLSPEYCLLESGVHRSIAGNFRSNFNSHFLDALRSDLGSEVYREKRA